MKTLPKSLALAITAAVLAPAGCVLPHTLSWELVWSDSALEDRAVAVEASIREGGCGGVVVWTTEIGPGGGEDPPDLEEGRYGFEARARDLDCRWFAEGCRAIELPADDNDGEVRVVLSASAEANACTGGACVAGVCSATPCEREGCSCIAGGCAIHCGRNGSCSCVGGGCDLRCDAGAECSCVGGTCAMDCEAGASCSCLGGGCTCQGDGCG